MSQSCFVSRAKQPNLLITTRSVAHIVTCSDPCDQFRKPTRLKSYGNWRGNNIMRQNVSVTLTNRCCCGCTRGRKCKIATSMALTSTKLTYLKGCTRHMNSSAAQARAAATHPFQNEVSTPFHANVTKMTATRCMNMST